MPLSWAFVDVVLTRCVVPAERSRTKTSDERLVSDDTRLVAWDTKATKRPLSLMTAASLGPFGAAPPTPTSTRSPGGCGPHEVSPHAATETAITATPRRTYDGVR